MRPLGAFLVFVSILFLAHSAKANTEDTEYRLNRNPFTYHETPTAACKTARPNGNLLGFDQDERYKYECQFPQGTLPTVTEVCVERDDNGDVVAAGVSDGPCENFFNTCIAGGLIGSIQTLVGNPIDVRNRVNVEQALDWASPKEPRFRFMRHYRSDGSLAAGFQASSRPEHLSGWRTEFNDGLVSRENDVYGDELLYINYTGSAIPLKSVSGQGDLVYESKFAGSYIEVFESSTQNNRLILRTGNGVDQTFHEKANGTVLESKEWPDGYKITIARSNVGGGQQGRILSVSDNRGNFAEYTWQNNIVPGATDAFVTQIEIDTNYSGTFSPEVRLNYEYRENAFLNAGSGNSPQLFRVRRTDLVNTPGNAREIWRYSYTDIDGVFRDGVTTNTPAYPFLLETIRDGREDAKMAAFNYAEFEYSFDDILAFDYGRTPEGILRNLRPASKTRVAQEGDIAANITYGEYSVSGGTLDANSARVEVLGPLGRTTVYHTDKRLTPDSVANVGMPVIEEVEGIQINTCLGTLMEFDNIGPAGAGPEQYVYQRTEKNGSITQFERNARALVTKRTENATAGANAQRVTEYGWNTTYRKPRRIETSELKELFTYDADGLVTSYTQEDVLVGSPDFGNTRTWTYTYQTVGSDGLKVLTSVDGPAAASVGDITTYTYNSDGTVDTITDPNNLTTEFVSYSAIGLPSLVRLPDQTEWTMSYDEMGRVTNATLNPGNSSFLFTYDVVGLLTQMTNSEGETWNFTYNAGRNLTEILDPAEDSIVYDYDAMGNVTRVRHRTGGTSSTTRFRENYNYDEMGRLMDVLGALSQSTTIAYNRENDPNLITDTQGNDTSFNYNNLRQLTKWVDRANNDTFYKYNDADQITEYTDQGGLVTDYTYNGFGEVVTEASPDRGTTTYTYNSRGLVKTMTTASTLPSQAVTVTYSYDAGGRITDIDYPSPSGEDVDFAYDTQNGGGTNGAGKLVGTTFEIGETDYEYRSNGRLRSVTQTLKDQPSDPSGHAYDVEYQINAEGRITVLDYPSGRSVRYTYDTAGYLDEIETKTATSSWEVVVTNIRYRPLGPVRALEYGDGAEQTRTFDNSFRMTRLEDERSGTTLRDLSYAWTDRDNLATITDNLAAANNETYGYNARELLTSANSPAYPNIGITYNAIGARKTYTAGGQTNTYEYFSVSNRLNRIRDENNNVISDFRYLNAASWGSIVSDNTIDLDFGYNDARRLTTVSKNGSQRAEYYYDTQGRQVVRRLLTSGDTIHNIFDVDGNRIAEYEYDASNSTSTILREYIWMMGEPVAVVEYTGGTPTLYYVRTDHIGRPTFATNGSGTVVWTLEYLPFGQVRASTGSPIDLRFPGQWFQAESGLHHNWMRDYDPVAGRYIEADPLGLIDGPSVYGYAAQNPMRYIDPTGEVIPVAGFYAGAALASVTIGFAYDTLLGDGCYTPLDLAFDASLGIFGGSAFKTFGLVDEVFNSWLRFGSGASSGVTFRAATELVKRPHGNNKLSPEPQILYNLIDIRTGEIAKIGLTGARIGAKRYSQGFYIRNNVRFVPVARYSSRLIGYAVEGASLVGYYGRYGSLPRLNKGFR